MNIFTVFHINIFVTNKCSCIRIHWKGCRNYATFCYQPTSSNLVNIFFSAQFPNMVYYTYIQGFSSHLDVTLQTGIIDPNTVFFVNSFVRIQESVVVPGAVKDESGTLVAGSIQAKVFADDVGEAYNIPAGKTFDIPGFQENKLTDGFFRVF